MKRNDILNCAPSTTTTTSGLQKMIVNREADISQKQADIKNIENDLVANEKVYEQAEENIKEIQQQKKIIIKTQT